MGQRAKLGNAVPAGYEDSDEEHENFTAISLVSSKSVEVVQKELKDKEDLELKTVHSISTLTLTIHTGPLTPSPLSKYTTYTDITVSQASSPHQFSAQPGHGVTTHSTIVLYRYIHVL